MMKIKQSLKFKVGLLIALLSTALYAAIIFNPGNMPPVTLAPYALKYIDIPTTGNHAYRPWFENGAWQGDLIEYDLATDGTRTTDADPGSNPPRAGTNNWMARATFAGLENPSGNGLTFTTYWQDSDTGRHIFTSDGAGTQIKFLWSQLTDSQKAELDPVTLALDATGDYDSPILNYVRGDHSEEKKKNGIYRNRFSLLGDIINSNPVYFGPARETYTIPGFPAFKDSIKNNDGRIAVGANDGMLHVFDEDDGSEAYAYIPSMLIGKLPALLEIPYNHTYYVDGGITVASAQNGSTWMSVLTGTLGAGGKGLYALNVTNPDMSTNKVLFEKTGDDIGYIFGRPRIARKQDNKWYVFTGNGLNSVNGVAKLLMFELNGSTYTQTALSTGVAGGLSAPVLVDLNKDFKADVAFAGDTNGDLWKFYLGSYPPATNPVKIFDGSPDRPILSAPAVAAHPYGGLMVFWATGSSLSMEEARDSSYPTQAIYGVWDSAIGTTMVTQVLKEDTDVSFGSNIETIRYIETNNAVDYNCTAHDSTCAKGWVVELPNTGERILGTPQIRAGRVSVISSNPRGKDATNLDLIGDSWLLSLHFLTGGDDNQVVYDLNEDGDKDLEDTVNLGTADVPDQHPPVGLYLGDGNISQPVLGRLSEGEDIMYINGLRLPIPQTLPPDGPFLTGHIDVHTDSPNEYPLAGGSIAPNNRNKHSDHYSIRTSDGLGRGVDGHFHRYDTVNNVHYVDLFQLEPRRGKADLDAVTTGELPCSTTENEKEVEIGGKCVSAVEGELNRAYDTLQTDADGKADATRESEVYEIGKSTPLSSTDKFIIVSANGDLTPAARLQIGCRTWKIEDYENMITAQLENGVAPADLKDLTHGITDSETLVFTLAEIADGTADSSTCPADSQKPTLRLSFSTRDILDGAVHGTRSQCVLGLHDYHDRIDYWDENVLCYAPKYLYGETVSCGSLDEPDAGYFKDPADNLHITESLEGNINKYRWRNGALTLQLLKVNNSTDAAEFELQSSADLPTNRGKRMGGTYAKAFTRTGSTITASKIDESLKWNESGLLYELSMYWHLGNFAEDIQRADPASIPCYGDASWGSVFTQETRGLTEGQYEALFDGIDAAVLSDYDDAVRALEAALKSGTESAIEAAVLALSQLLAAHPELQNYDNYRDYAPGNIPEQHLRDLDKGYVPPENAGSTEDGIPAGVVDLEGLDTQTVGPNYQAGRRTWIDLKL